jgi:hypothetical protein
MAVPAGDDPRDRPTAAGIGGEVNLRGDPPQERPGASRPDLTAGLSSFGPAPEPHSGGRDNLLGDIGQRQVAGTGGMGKGQSTKTATPNRHRRTPQPQTALVTTCRASCARTCPADTKTHLRALACPSWGAPAVLPG